MTDDFDLDAYLRRISYDGSREPSLGVLSAVVAAHAAAIPYENIDVLLKRGVRLDLGSLQHKLVHGGRGGYCFEQNTLLEAGLRSLGFAMTRLVARVVRGASDPAEVGRNHKVLYVDLPEGPYIADVGFGSLTPTAPLALRPEQVQETPHEPFRLMPHGSEFLMQARLGEVWDNLFRFSLEPTPAVDYEMGNWFTSTCPGSPFLDNLIVARPVAGGRITVYNRRFTIRDHDNRTVRRPLDGIGDYRDVLVGELAWRSMMTNLLPSLRRWRRTHQMELCTPPSHNDANSAQPGATDECAVSRGPSRLRAPPYLGVSRRPTAVTEPLVLHLPLC